MPLMGCLQENVYNYSDMNIAKCYEVIKQLV